MEMRSNFFEEQVSCASPTYRSRKVLSNNFMVSIRMCCREHSATRKRVSTITIALKQMSFDSSGAHT